MKLKNECVVIGGAHGGKICVVSQHLNFSAHSQEKLFIQQEVHWSMKRIFKNSRLLYSMLHMCFYRR